MIDPTSPTMQQISSNLWLLDEMEVEELFELRTALADDTDPALDDLWTLVCIRTSSLEI